MTAIKFWMGWLKISMLLVILGGVILALSSVMGGLPVMDKMIDSVFFMGKIPGEAAVSMRNWMAGVTGAVMVGWGCSMFYVVNHALKKREQWAWRCIFYPVLAWFIIDSLISAYFHVGFNVLLNTVLFLQLVAPLLFIRNHFFHQLNPGS